MPELDEVPDWLWVLGACASYCLLIWVQPARETFATGFAWAKKYGWVSLAVGSAGALYVVWARVVEGTPPPAPISDGIAHYSAAAPLAFLQACTSMQSATKTNPISGY